jgi:pyruvate dehydrogenase E2 component (dihydrolipoamide acetyltransferase)
LPEITMPRLSDSMEEGTILKWLVAEGDEVSKGQEIAEIETDKATMTYEADEAGVFHPVAGEGDTLPIGEVIATIGEDAPSQNGASAGGSDGGDEEPEAEPSEEDEAEAEPSEEDRAEPSEDEEEKAEPRAGADGGGGEGGGEAAEAPPAKASGGADANGRVKASPVARRLAKEQGVDLSSVEGTGPGGRIVKADVEKAASGEGKPAAKKDEAPAKEAPKKEAPKREERPTEREGQPAAASAAASPGTSEPKVAETGTTKGDVSVVELTRTQQVVARRMAESKATVPEFTLVTEIDMENAVALRKRLKEIAGEDDVVPSFNDMVVKASAVALRGYPRANGSYKDGKFELYSRVNVGVAVAAQNSLVVPVVHDADQKSMGNIARDVRKLAARVRDGTISPPELAGGTFTVSNLGMYGITEFTAVINPPQAAILAVGAMERRPVVVDDRGKIEARHRMNVSLVCDHRILYGADAAEFLGRIRALLEEPLALAL